MYSWSRISSLGKNRMVNRSYVYLFIVPIIAKSLSEIESPVNIFLGGTQYELILELPFTWILFYSSAMAFTVATIIFYLRCPSIIKENSSFASFLDEKKGNAHILSYANELGINTRWYMTHSLNQERFPHLRAIENHALRNADLRALPKSFKQEEVDKLITYYKLSEEINADVLYEKKLGSKFWALFNYSNKSRRRALNFCSTFYIIGLFLIGSVLLEGLLWVLRLYIF